MHDSLLIKSGTKTIMTNQLAHVACLSCGSYRGRVYREAIRSAHTK